uniref:Uncharacterized protein n=1 Tax=Glossina austeni TaxID=7395 RepID=A0A1A9VX08_GLOAU
MTFRCVYCNGLNPARLSVLLLTLTEEFHFNESTQEEKEIQWTMDSNNNNDSNLEMNDSLASSRRNELENRMRVIRNARKQMREELEQQLRLRTRSETLPSELSGKVEKPQASKDDLPLMGRQKLQTKAVDN